MAPTSFSLFVELPKELRLTIWEFALRPPVPGYQRFSVTDPRSTGLRNNPPARQEMPRSQRVDVRELSRPTDISAPLAPNMTTPINWHHASNDSLYLTDTGLFDACAESQAVVARAHRAHRNQHAPDLTHIHITSWEGYRRIYMTIAPLTDLFCLEPDHQVHPIFWDIILQYTAARPHTSLYEVLGDWKGVRNVGFMYDPSWMDNLPSTLSELEREPSPRGLFTQAMRDCTRGSMADAVLANPPALRFFLVDPSVPATEMVTHNVAPGLEHVRRFLGLRNEYLLTSTNAEQLRGAARDYPRSAYDFHFNFLRLCVQHMNPFGFQPGRPIAPQVTGILLVRNLQ